MLILPCLFFIYGTLQKKEFLNNELKENLGKNFAYKLAV